MAEHEHEHIGHIIVSLVVSLIVFFGGLLMASDWKSHEDYVRGVACAAAVCPTSTTQAGEIEALQTQVAILSTPEAQ